MDLNNEAVADLIDTNEAIFIAWKHMVDRQQEREDSFEPPVPDGLKMIAGALGAALLESVTTTATLLAQEGEYKRGAKLAKATFASKYKLEALERVMDPSAMQDMLEEDDD